MTLEHADSIPNEDLLEIFKYTSKEYSILLAELYSRLRAKKLNPHEQEQFLETHLMHKSELYKMIEQKDTIHIIK